MATKLLYHTFAKVWHKCSHKGVVSCLDNAHTSVSHHFAGHITKCIIPRRGGLFLLNTPARKHTLKKAECACMGAFNVGRECGVTPIIPQTMPPQQPLATPSLPKQPRNSTLIHTKTPQIEQCNVIRRNRAEVSE